MNYFAKLTKEADGYSVEFPELPGCVSEGDTLQEALGMASEALDLWLKYLLDKGKDIPMPKVHAGKGFHAIPVDARLAVAINIRISRGRRSMAEIAESIGTSTQNYFRYEHSKANPTVSTLEKIAKATGKRLEISFV